MRSMAMTTMEVESVSSLYFFAPFSFGSQGQEAFWSSLLTSLMKFLVLANIQMRERNETGTAGGNRTPNRRFWRPLLYQLSYRRRKDLGFRRRAAGDRDARLETGFLLRARDV